MNPTYTNPNANFFPSSPSTTLDATKLGQTPQVQLPVAPQDTTNYAGVITSIPTFQEIQSQITQTNPAEQTADDLMQRILGTSQKLGGKTEAQLRAEETAGLPQFQTQLRDVTSQISGLQREAMAIPLQIQQESQGRGVTAGGIAPIQTGRLRENAIKSLTLSTIAETLQGNIANAQATADRAIQLEFAPIEAELNTLKTAYEMNKDILSRVDKKRAEQLNFTLQERERVLTNQKEDRKTVLGFIAEAAKNGAPTLMLQRASQASDPTDALSMLSQYMSDPEAKANALMDRKYKQAQIDRIYEDIALSKKELAMKYSTETGKPLTDAQATSLGYAQRIAESKKVIDRIGGQFASGGSYLGQFAPNILKSEDRQLFEQAQRNFINAVLRKESGAVISEEEFNNARKQYFPQPGDTQATLTQKKQNRDTVHKNFLRNAGNPPELTQAMQNVVTAPDGTQVIITD